MIISTDPDFVETQSTSLTHEVPIPFTRNFKNDVRQLVTDFKNLPSKHYKRSRTGRRTLRTQLYSMLVQIVLATDTKFLLDHDSPRTVISKDGALTLTMVCPCGEANGRLTIFPLFGFMIRFIIKELPELGINKIEWIMSLSTLFFTDVLGVASEDVPVDANKFNLSHPIVRAFFETRVIKPFIELGDIAYII